MLEFVTMSLVDYFPEIQNFENCEQMTIRGAPEEIKALASYALKLRPMILEIVEDFFECE